MTRKASRPEHRAALIRQARESIFKATRSADAALDHLQTTSDPLSALTSANAAELELRIAQAHLTNAWKLDKEREQT